MTEQKEEDSPSSGDTLKKMKTLTMARAVSSDQAVVPAEKRESRKTEHRGSSDSINLSTQKQQAQKRKSKSIHVIKRDAQASDPSQSITPKSGTSTLQKKPSIIMRMKTFWKPKEVRDS